MDTFQVLKKPIITEKTARLMEKENKYTFEVPTSATKTMVKQAVRDLYGVTILSVNMVKTSPKSKRSWVGKRGSYQRNSIKKAIVELKSGESLKIYEGGAKS